MKLTPEDIDKLKNLELANVIRKLHAKKTLTAREDAMLERARASSTAGVQTPAPSTLPSGYAQTYDQLADALGVSRKSLQNWRGRADLVGKFPTPRADGRHDIAAWARFMVEHGLARADEDVEIEALEGKPRTVAEWKAKEGEMRVRRMQRDEAKEDNALLVATELEVAFGQLLAGICAALNQLPGAAARFIVGLRDVHLVQERLEESCNGILQHLSAARYLEDCVADVVRELPIDEEMEQLMQTVAFAGQDRAALLQLGALVARAALRRVGERALGQLSTSPAPSGTEPGRADDSPPELPRPKAPTPDASADRSAPPAPRAESIPDRRPARKRARRRAELPAAARKDQASDRPQPQRRKSTKKRKR